MQFFVVLSFYEFYFNETLQITGQILKNQDSAQSIQL